MKTREEILKARGAITDNISKSFDGITEVIAPTESQSRTSGTHDSFEKGRAANIGDIRTMGGKQMIKQFDGWKPYDAKKQAKKKKDASDRVTVREGGKNVSYSRKDAKKLGFKEHNFVDTKKKEVKKADDSELDQVSNIFEEFHKAHS